MHHGQTSRRLLRAALVAAGLAPLAAVAQVQQQAAARTIVPLGAKAEAVAHYSAGLADLDKGNFAAAQRHFLAALASDEGFGLARSRTANALGGAPSQPEHARAAVDAARGSAPEALMALAYREQAAGRAPNARALWDALAALVPDDQVVALERAKSRPGDERVPAIREVMARFPDYAAPRWELLLARMPAVFEVMPADVAEEVGRLAADVARLHPDEAGTHLLLGFVDLRSGRHESAIRHLDAAIAKESMHFAYEFKAEIMAREKKAAAARALLDSAIASSPSAPGKVTYRRNQALLRAYDGRIADAIAAMRPVLQQAEAGGMNGAAATTATMLAVLQATNGDAAAAKAAHEEARRLGVGTATLAENQIIVAALLADGAAAKAALAEWERATASQTGTARVETLHRLTGLASLAAADYVAAVRHLRMGGANPWTQLGVSEALRKMGRLKEAKTVRDELLARKNVSIASTAVVVAMQRAKKG